MAVVCDATTRGAMGSFFLCFIPIPMELLFVGRKYLQEDITND